jgi:hypothetical protein
MEDIVGEKIHYHVESVVTSNTEFRYQTQRSNSYSDPLPID